MEADDPAETSTNGESKARIASSQTPTMAVMVLNPSKDAPAPYNLDVGGGRVARLTMPPRSLQTLLVPLN